MALKDESLRPIGPSFISGSICTGKLRGKTYSCARFIVEYPQLDYAIVWLSIYLASSIPIFP
jgi:hypothetical protein